MREGKIKWITPIIPPLPPRVEHEAEVDLQGVMEGFERLFPFSPALSRFDVKADPITNFKRVVFKKS